MQTDPVNNLKRQQNTSECMILAKQEYIKRHDTMCAELHFNICKEMGGKLNNEQWYDHLPISVETSPEGKLTILWNQQCKLKINWTS
jgi:hypothetical protein